MSSDLSGQVIIVTGGSRNIGYFAAAGLARRGATVAIIGRDAQALDQARQRIGEQAVPIAADIADRTALLTAIDEVRRRCGRIDGLVNNAGVSYVSPVEKLQAEDVLRQINVNFLAAVYASQAVIPDLRRQGGGRIVNVSSDTVHQDAAFAWLSIYSASKAALEQFSKELRSELAGDNIAVTTFVPGNTRTGFGGGWNPDIARAAYGEWLAHGSHWAGMMSADSVGEGIARCFDMSPECSLDVVVMRPVGKRPKVMEQDL
jgi:NAD(P)-dependent dehydrogenase (short-subunit alcohol dehydrogenase family)